MTASYFTWKRPRRITLWTKTQGSLCRTLESSAESYIPRTDIGTPGVYMPDVSVVCGERRYHPVERRAFLHPVSILEVRSLTEKRDYSAKFVGYRSIETLREYILISHTTSSSSIGGSIPGKASGI